jgi:hypothetical protein
MIHGEIAPATLGIEIWMCFRASMDVSEKRKISCLCGESEP